MDKSDLAVDETTHENIVTIADGSRDRENLATLGMRPPTPADWCSSDELSERRSRPTCRFEDDAALPDERESLA
jgi:hypothetical protein